MASLASVARIAEYCAVGCAIVAVAGNSTLSIRLAITVFYPTLILYRALNRVAISFGFPSALAAPWIAVRSLYLSTSGLVKHYLTSRPHKMGT
jgi:hypothetical protein